MKYQDLSIVQFYYRVDHLGSCSKCEQTSYVLHLTCSNIYSEIVVVVVVVSFPNQGDQDFLVKGFHKCLVILNQVFVFFSSCFSCRVHVKT